MSLKALRNVRLVTKSGLKVYSAGESVKAEDLNKGQAEKLVSRGFLAETEKPKVKAADEPTVEAVKAVDEDVEIKVTAKKEKRARKKRKKEVEL